LPIHHNRDNFDYWRSIAPKTRNKSLDERERLRYFVRNENNELVNNTDEFLKLKEHFENEFRLDRELRKKEEEEKLAKMPPLRGKSIL